MMNGILKIKPPGCKSQAPAHREMVGAFCFRRLVMNGGDLQSFAKREESSKDKTIFLITK
jgi:hypothetical protein